MIGPPSTHHHPAPGPHGHHHPAPGPGHHHAPAPGPGHHHAPAPGPGHHHAPAPGPGHHHAPAPGPGHHHHAPAPGPGHHHHAPAPGPGHHHHAPAPGPGHHHHAPAPGPSHHHAPAPGPGHHHHHAPAPGPSHHHHHAPAPGPSHHHSATVVIPHIPIPHIHINPIPAPCPVPKVVVRRHAAGHVDAPWRMPHVERIIHYSPPSGTIRGSMSFLWTRRTHVPKMIDHFMVKRSLPADDVKYAAGCIGESLDDTSVEEYYNHGHNELFLVYLLTKTYDLHQDGIKLLERHLMSEIKFLERAQYNVDPDFFRRYNVEPPASFPDNRYRVDCNCKYVERTKDNSITRYNMFCEKCEFAKHAQIACNLLLVVLIVQNLIYSNNSQRVVHLLPKLRQVYAETSITAVREVIDSILISQNHSTPGCLGNAH